MRDKRLTYVDKTKQSIYSFSDGALCFFLPDGCSVKPLQRSELKNSFEDMLSKIINVCERLFEELVKEWLQNRYTIVSGSFREVNGRRIRIRKGHLRRKRH